MKRIVLPTVLCTLLQLATAIAQDAGPPSESDDRPSPVEGLQTTFIGGPPRQNGSGGNPPAVFVATDNEGNAYVAGQTHSLNLAGAQTDQEHSTQAFVAQARAGGGVGWCRYLSVPHENTAVRAIGADRDGNSFTVLEPTMNLPGGPKDEVGIPLVKITRAGEVAWVRNIASHGEAHAILVDFDGNVFVGGTVPTKYGEKLHGAINEPLGTSDGFVSKVNGQTGQILWATYVGGRESNIIEALTLDADRNIYAAGGAGWTWRTRESPERTDYLPPDRKPLNRWETGDADRGLVCKLSRTGQLQWSLLVGGTQTDSCLGIAPTAGGGVCVVGNTTSFDFKPTPKNEWTTRLGGDLFLLNLTSEGATRWCVFGHSVEHAGLRDLTRSADGNLLAIVAGHGGHTHLEKYDRSSGKRLWASDHEDLRIGGGFRMARRRAGTICLVGASEFANPKDIPKDLFPNPKNQFTFGDSFVVTVRDTDQTGVVTFAEPKSDAPHNDLDVPIKWTCEAASDIAKFDTYLNSVKQASGSGDGTGGRTVGATLNGKGREGDNVVRVVVQLVDGRTVQNSMTFGIDPSGPSQPPGAADPFFTGTVVEGSQYKEGEKVPMTWMIDLPEEIKGFTTLLDDEVVSIGGGSPDDGTTASGDDVLEPDSGKHEWKLVVVTTDGKKVEETIGFTVGSTTPSKDKGATPDPPGRPTPPDSDEPKPEPDPEKPKPEPDPDEPKPELLPDEPKPLPAPDEPRLDLNGLVAQKKSVLPGEVVTVAVDAKDVSKLGSLNFVLRYDPKVAEVEKVDKGDLLERSSAMFKANPKEPGVIRFGFAGSAGVSGNGPVVQIVFKAVGKAGDETDLSISEIDPTDTSGNPVHLAKRDGKVTIIKEEEIMTGDSNNDGEVTILDSLDALSMSVKLIPEDLKADMDENGRVTAEDARRILVEVIQ